MTHRIETKIFDPADGFAPFVDPIVVTDASVAKRGNQWWLYLGRANLLRRRSQWGLGPVHDWRPGMGGGPLG
jgi:hypothetical protein